MDIGHYNKIACPALRDKVISAAEGAALIRPGMTVAFGGVTSAGYPKAVPLELAKRQNAGENLSLTMITATINRQLDDLLADAVERRMPMIEGSAMRKKVNYGHLHYVERPISKVTRSLQSGKWGNIDVAVIEALAITEEGHIIPSSSVGILPYLLERSAAVVIEINTALPDALIGLHDIFVPGEPPNRKVIPLTHPTHRFGEIFARVDPGKIKGIVFTEVKDESSSPSGPTEITERITENLFHFMKMESKNWKENFPPIQTGIGNLANNILHAFQDSEYENLSFFCGALHEAHLELISSGKVTGASASSIQMTDRTIEILKEKSNGLKDILVLRNQDITNESEVIGRLGLIALNSAIEIDIYGNVNTSHIHGTKVVNGIGGGGNYAQNAGLSIILLPSVNGKEKVPTIIPMVTHVDISEHDVDVVITEWGFSDLRGKDDVERAFSIIENCANPEHRISLRAYLERARENGNGHHPQNPQNAYEWYEQFKR